MRVRLRHETRYRYPRPALLGPHLVRLHPAAHARADLLTYQLGIEPAHQLRWQQDPSGNRIARVTFPSGRGADELSVVVDCALEIRPVNPFDFFVDDDAKEIPFVYAPGLAAELAPYRAQRELGPRTRAFVESLAPRGYVTEWLVELNRRVASEVRYVIRDEAGIQTSEETLAVGRGSCRDSAVLLVDALRARGLAARFVSGYLVQLADEGDIPEEQRGVSHDVVDLHAWAEVFVPGGGWIGLDGTSGLLCGEGHVPLACTADPVLASPVEGTASEPGAITFSMEIARIGHEPSPKRPYTEDQWKELVACGHRVDDALGRRGITLTMGGEPTFVSRAHVKEPEWNTTALGETKWTHGVALARELATRFGGAVSSDAAGGARSGVLVMQRMGKHYPGESLPRWAIDLIWRRDGEPIWRDLRRLAFPGKEKPNVEIGEAQADTLARAIARRLGVETTPVAGYEDPWVHAVQEENLPDDVDPLAASLRDPEARRTLARVLGRGLDRVVGYAVPIGREGERWVTSKWSFRRGAMFLVPGDSPMGLRLPLDRLPGSPPPFFEKDPTTVGEAFAPRMQRPGDIRPVHTLAADGILRTALVTEVRDGVMHVFVPPMPSADDFLELVAIVEDASVETGLPVRVEGYAPPHDARLRTCAVTPDPGVLEVNVPFTDRFGEYVSTMETIADAARHAGLTTMKLQLDGRESGTGGGHHLTLGGPSPNDSPFLRRPDLLASLLRYLQAHPSLSYLFTGLFVGPTSQAPRIDEARHESLYELELALARIPRHGSSDTPPPPWLIDRLLRNLLIDVSGNTHRTELSIDKLWDPGSPSGRLGLVELRAFEMPPHERMAVAQMLLVRGMMSMLAASPWEKPLVRWGSELHDRFMLPHYLWRDLEDVLADLERSGVTMDGAWFRPFLELRCPMLGKLQTGDVSLELRAAIEPWPVLGDEPLAGGTARHVDSSLERVEVRVDGLVEGRHAVMVNGLMLPLRATGRAAERVAGVRFRAWQPPFCLQPTIGLHHPLRFDVVDLWARRSLGACTYHVWHPEGRAYDEPPLTLAEAAARRAARFTTLGHAPHPVVPIETKPHPDQPFTLDLRRYPVDRRVNGG
ncbi:DUF2126 domain-containing protein [Sandaracinus amylolyticus]|uniref:transglutaminase family protein n=1 Tax=Sandaracinus amylolyticus TaxID=927083 RepID=UPI001F22C484|nr:transglutaminase family protein [Sandaracinus amylolyticus]UJR87207.1 Hypothetical protein I5071_93080 [Sandaracinus amylolyticus]